MGHEEALASIIEEYYTSLYNYAFKFCHDGDLAKDCIQEVFISLWQRRDSATSIVSLKYYLLRAIKNKILKSLHRLSVNRGLSTASAEAAFQIELSTEDLLIRDEALQDRNQLVSRIVQELSSREKEIIYLKFYEQLDNNQISELMSINVQSVYNLLHRSLLKLRHLWLTDPNYHQLRPSAAIRDFVKKN